jgi:hypothetical protein
VLSVDYRCGTRAPYLDTIFSPQAALKPVHVAEKQFSFIVAATKYQAMSCFHRQK